MPARLFPQPPGLPNRILGETERLDVDRLDDVRIVRHRYVVARSNAGSGLLSQG